MTQPQAAQLAVAFVKPLLIRALILITEDAAHEEATFTEGMLYRVP